MTSYKSEQNLPRWFYNRIRTCRDAIQFIHRVHSSEQNVPRWLPTNRSRTCRYDFIPIGAELAEMTLYKSGQIYFASHLLHGSRRAHQELLPSYPALSVQFRIFFDEDAQPMFRFTYIYYTKGLHVAVAKPTYAPGSSSPIADHFISHKDTSDWSSPDPYSRASATLKKLISRLRDILQGRYTTDPCHYCIAAVAAMHYC